MTQKFRAWDKKNEAMSHKVRVSTYIDETMVEIANQLHWVERSFSDVILMQFTGLKDKNGVEIYEGDVLTLKYPRDRRYIVTAKVIRGTQISAMVLKFEDEFTTEEIPLYKISAEHNLEVLGNIYENPELLVEMAE